MSQSPTVRISAAESVESRINLLGVICRVAETVLAWRQRAFERGQLAAMDERLRRDIGLSRIDVWHEANKPFWRD